MVGPRAIKRGAPNSYPTEIYYLCIESFRELISRGTVFFSHNKSVSADLSAAQTVSQTANQRIKQDMRACFRS